VSEESKIFPTLRTKVQRPQATQGRYYLASAVYDMDSPELDYLSTLIRALVSANW